MNLTCIFFGLLFCIAGLVFMTGKGHIHLAAWKAMPDTEKEKIRIMPLCRNIGGMIALCGVIFLIGGLWPGFKDYVFVWAMILWLICAGADVFYISKSKRYFRE